MYDTLDKLSGPKTRVKMTIEKLWLESRGPTNLPLRAECNVDTARCNKNLCYRKDIRFRMLNSDKSDDIVCQLSVAE